MPTGDGAGRAEEEDNEEDDEAELAAALARNPRIVGYDERGGAEAAEEARRAAEERRNAPLGIHDFFSGYCDEADMYLPIRAKYVKKHGRIISKFDHYCYMLGNSVGELNHGRFWRLLAMQVFSIWTGEWLLSHAYLSLFKSTVLWTVSNIPLIIMNIITWFTGLSLSFLLVSHTFMCLTSSTTYEFIKLEKLEYLQGFYQFSYPFSEGLCENVRHFCCPRAIKLWRRARRRASGPRRFGGTATIRAAADLSCCLDFSSTRTPDGRLDHDDGTRSEREADGTREVVLCRRVIARRPAGAAGGVVPPIHNVPSKVNCAFISFCVWLGPKNSVCVGGGLATWRETARTSRRAAAAVFRLRGASRRRYARRWQRSSHTRMRRSWPCSPSRWPRAACSSSTNCASTMCLSRPSFQPHNLFVPPPPPL